MLKKIISIVSAVVVLALASYISFDIPLTEINITGQTMAVLCIAFIFKPQVSIPSIIIYLILGILGVPLFSAGNSGWAYFRGPSLGYFVGFVLSMILIANKFWKQETFAPKQFIPILIYQICGTVIILICGGLRLVSLMGIEDAILKGVTPFLLSGITKALFGSILVYYFYKWRSD